MAPVMPPERRPRRRVRRRSRIRPRALIALVVLLVLGTVGAVLAYSRQGQKTTAHDRLDDDADQTTARRHAHAVARPVQRDLAETVTGSLPAPLMDPSYVSSGGRIVLLGGLDAADTSVDTVIAAGYHGSAVIGRLPSVRHDTAAAVLGALRLRVRRRERRRRSSTTSCASIRRRRGRRWSRTCPAASSDSTAAAIGGTAYVVGGYTGTRWLDTIVAYRPGKPARVVAHLPQTLRYAAVTAVGETLVIAGGSLENGPRATACSHSIPATHRVTRSARSLPRPRTRRQRRSATSPT